MDFVDHSATRHQRRAVLAASLLLLAASAALLPSAGVQLQAVDHASGLYGCMTAVVDLATFMLLAGGAQAHRSHRILSAAYLFAGLMAVLHVLAFPGAVQPGRALVGDGHGLGWIFNTWHVGFPVLILWALVAQRWPGRAPAAAVIAPEAVALGLAALAAAASFLPDMRHDAAALPDPRFSQLNVLASYVCAGLSLLGLALIHGSGLARRSVYLWISLVMAADAAGIVIGTIGGGRYTLGWYVSRVEGVLASVVVLAVLSMHFRSLQDTLVSTVRDLRLRTDALQAEIQRRERAERMLLQSQKLEAVGQLAAGLAHDFNNLMQVIVARLEILRRRAGEQAEADVEVIRRNVRRAEGLTRQLLLFTGRREPRPARVHLQELLPGLVDMLRPLVRTDIPIELDAPADVPAVEVDVEEFEVAMTNLATNARDAMPEGGTIRLALRGEGGHVMLRVTDEGGGIPAAVADRVFEPFFTTKAPGKGAGLGLSQVQAFVAASGGDVRVASDDGLGTTIELRFPALADDATDAAPADGEAAAAPAPRPARHGTILLVDDSDDVRESTSMLLQHVGYSVQCAGSAREALALLSAGPLPTAVVSDIVMPGDMDGLGLARELERRHPGTKVVLASGYSVAAERARNDRLVVLRKPYSIAQLLQALDAA